MAYKEHNLTEFLLKIEDPRDREMVIYPITEIFFLLISATISGCNEITEIQQFGKQKLEWLRGYFAYEKGIASHDTIGRVLSLVNKQVFEDLFIQWVSQHFGLDEAALINFDGKRLGSSATRTQQSLAKSEGGRYAEVIVNAFACAAGVVLAQSNVSTKMDEVQGAKNLLASLDIEGCCISGDNNFCGRNIIEIIIQRKADYLLALKGKSPKLYKAAQKAMADQDLVKTSHITQDQGHGRFEKREYYALDASYLPMDITKTYLGLKQIIMVKRYRKILHSGKEQNQTHYYITSLSSPIKDLADKIRAHWLIENQLHYVLDVTFGEDNSRLRTHNAASNLSLVRKVVLNLLRSQKEKGSLKSQRLRCAWSDQHRDHILNSMMR